MGGPLGSPEARARPSGMAGRWNIIAGVDMGFVSPSRR